MRIGIIVAGLSPERVGGAELQATRAAAGLATRHDVTVLARTRNIPEGLARLPRCRVIARPALRWPGPLRFAVDVVGTLAHLFRLRRTLDVVLAYQTVIDGLIGVLAKRAFGIPVVVSVRGAAEYKFDRISNRLFGPFVFRHADRLLVQSPAIAQELLAAFQARSDHATASIEDRLRIVPNGIDMPVEAPSAPRVVLFVGRLMVSKGVHILIEAMRACPRQYLTVVGDGPDRGRLEALARGLDNVTFAGVADRQQVEDHFRTARMLVLPSLQEGQPNVIMEAMARGVPVVASHVGGIPDLIQDGQTGLLVAPGDVAGLAAAIRRLASDTELHHIISNRSRREMEHYRWDRVLGLLENQLEEVAGPRKQPVDVSEGGGRGQAG